MIRALLLVLVPTALAAPTEGAEGSIHAWLSPADQSVTLPPAGRANLTYTWTVKFENTSCEGDAEVGIDFVFDQSATWPALSFQPSGAAARYPQDSGTTSLEVLVDPDAPRPAETRVHLIPEFGAISKVCTPTPQPREDPAYVTLRVPAPASSDPTTGSQGSPKDTPMPATGVLLAALALFVASRRR